MTPSPRGVGDRRRDPGGNDAIAGVIMHTDQGSGYSARTSHATCDRLGIEQSMGWVGSAVDNAVIESWYSTLEFELDQPTNDGV